VDINSLIAQAQAAQEQAAQEKAAKKQVQVEQARAQIAEALGDLWPTLSPLIQGEMKETWDRDELRHGFYWVDGHPLRLACFAICWSRGWQGPAVYFQTRSPDTGSGQQYPIEESSALFLYQRQALEEYEQKVREKAIEAALENLSTTWRGVKEPDKAEATYEKLLALAPERADKWQKALKTWQDNYAVEQRGKEREAEQTAQKQALKAQYADDYRAYYGEYQAVKARNEARRKAAQSPVDTPFMIWRLTYAYVAESEEGEHYADTRSAIVLAEKPDERGYWRVLQDGNEVGALRYWHPVSIDQGQLVKPSDGRYGRCIETDCGPVFVPPDWEGGKIHLEAEPYPESPYPPKGLAPWEVDDEQRAIRLSWEWEMEA